MAAAKIASHQRSTPFAAEGLPFERRSRWVSDRQNSDIKALLL
jgi:hypothetical protein